MAKPNKYQNIAEADHQKAEATLLRISFEYLDWDEGDLFFIHGLEADYYKKLFETLAEVKRSTEGSILTQTHPSLFAKSIFNTSTSKRTKFPEKIVNTIEKKLMGKSAEGGPADALQQAKAIVDRAFEVRVGKNYGRIHAFVWDKVFHVVWFDPAHNLYPGKGQSVKSPKEYATVKCYSSTESDLVREENRKLVDEHNVLLAKLEEQKRQYDELFEAFASK
jgi:hypothetical protein